METLKILLVEDEPNFAEAVSNSLRFYGHSIDSVKSFDVANWFLERNKYHLVICDLWIQGGHVGKLIKTIHEQYQTKVLLWSCEPPYSLEEYKKEMGADACYCKAGEAGYFVLEGLRHRIGEMFRH